MWVIEAMLSGGPQQSERYLHPTLAKRDRVENGQTKNGHYLTCLLSIPTER
jgi:hypothetical protein